MRKASLALFIGFLALALLYPLSRVLLLGAGPGFGETLADRYYWERLAWSLEYGAAGSLAVVALAVPLAFGLRYVFPGRALWVALAGVPFVMPTIVVAAGFLALLGPQGVLGVNLVGTPFLLVWAAVFYNYGFAARILHGLLAKSGDELEAAARTLGAGPLRAFYRVTLPALLPGLFAAGGLTFLYTFASFGVPLILGGYRYATLEVEIYRLLAYELDFEGASALILWQIVVLSLVSLGYLFASRRLAGELGYGGLRPLRKEKAFLLGALYWAGLILLLLPLFALFFASLKTPEGLGLGNYLRLFAEEKSYFAPGLGPALKNTLRFSFLALLLAAPAGLFYALAAWRGSVLTEVLGLLPLMVSPVSLGVGYLLAYPRLQASAFLLVLAYATLAYPLFARAVIPALRGIGEEVIQAAATLGASPWRRLFRVELPLIRPALFSGAALAFGSAAGEFGATLLLVRPEWATLSVAIYERLGKPGLANYGEAMAMSVVLLVLVAGVFYLFAKGAELG